MKINMDDQRLSAYALGEMSEAEKTAFDVLLEHDPEAQCEIAQIRSLASQLEAELLKEPGPMLSEQQRKTIRAAARRAVIRPAFRARVWTRYLAAASILVVVAVFFFLSPMGRLQLERAHISFTAKQTTTSSVGNTQSPPSNGQGTVNAPSISPVAPTASTPEATPAPTTPQPVPAPVSAPASAQPSAQKPPDAVENSSNMIPLRIDLPKPMFVGTPKNIVSDNLDPLSYSNSEAFLALPSASQPLPATPRSGTESYKGLPENTFMLAKKDPLSTFSIDVDTASFTNVRRFLNEGTFPPRDAVRIEELINYFRYDYAEPDPSGMPISVNVEIQACPWNADHSLARIGLRARSIPAGERPPLNLVFLTDVSGSMDEENKLPLLKKAMRLLVDSLTERDHVAIVTYASETGVALPATSGADKARILAALDTLRASGSTNGAGGIQLAYDAAGANFMQGAVNRVVLSTDGDFNVGISDTEQLGDFIHQKAQTGVFLSVLGFGKGNLQDDKLEALADKGNGHYAYIDSFREARRVLLDDITGTLVVVAKDVKVQVEFNPAKIGAYRLIGYESRALAARDFNDDSKDAGEMGAGHNVTALYELATPDKAAGLGGVDALKYQPGNPPEPASVSATSNDLMTIKVRYKQPDAADSARFELPVLATPTAPASNDFSFSAAVAMFGMLLRNSEGRGTATFDAALALAESSKGADHDGQRAECINLIRTARGLAPSAISNKAEANTPPPRTNRLTQAQLNPFATPRPAVLVPEGVHLLSRGCPVTASDNEPVIGEPSMVTDGDKEGSDGSFVEFAPGPQWVQIDLKRSYALYVIMMWHYYYQARVYRDVIVQVSNDPSFTKDVVTLFNNDHNNTSGLGYGHDKEYIEGNEGRMIDARGVQARYVRLYSNGNTSNEMNHWIEVEVFGK